MTIAHWSRPPGDALPALFGSREHGLGDLGFIDRPGGVNLDEGSYAQGIHGLPPQLILGARGIEMSRVTTAGAG